MRTVAACLASFAASLAFAQAPQAPPPTQPAAQPPTTTPQVQPPKVAATIADAAWLAGYWAGDGFGGVCEDTWMPPRNGMMLGAFRLTKTDGSRGFYELLGVEEFEGSLRLVVKHFHPDWVGWEEKDVAQKFRLTKLTADELVFGGLAFQRTAPDAFVFRLTMRMKDGTSKVESINFRKQPL